MTSESPLLWTQGTQISLDITDLSATGDGVGHYGPERRVVFVPDTVPGDRILARLMRVKTRFAQGQLTHIQQASPHRIRPACIVADKCGGCQWQTVDYDYQLRAKRSLVVEALERIGKLSDPPVVEVLPAATPLGYRNKVTYPFGHSTREGQPIIQTGYYQKRSHRLINLNHCPIQDPRLTPILNRVKQSIQAQGWSIYDEATHQGELRHLSLRIGRRTGEILVTLVARTGELPSLAAQAQQWLTELPSVVGIAVNHNPDRTNRIFGTQTVTVAGRPDLQEQFAGLTYHIQPTTFFQVYTEQAEALLQVILAELNLTGSEVILDAYCGIGTLTLPLAQQAATCIGIEVQATAVEQARLNAHHNQISNVTFHADTVAHYLNSLLQQPDIVLLDPPRKGLEATVIQSLIQAQVPRLVYVSCNPATLARDLDLLCHQGPYQLTRVQPADFFPQTFHVECAAFLRLKQA